jgi:hypothetical protein
MISLGRCRAGVDQVARLPGRVTEQPASGCSEAAVRAEPVRTCSMHRCRRADHRHRVLVLTTRIARTRRWRRSPAPGERPGGPTSTRSRTVEGAGLLERLTGRSRTADRRIGPVEHDSRPQGSGVRWQGYVRWQRAWLRAAQHRPQCVELHSGEGIGAVAPPWLVVTPGSTICTLGLGIR